MSKSLKVMLPSFVGILDVLLATIVALRYGSGN